MHHGSHCAALVLGLLLSGCQPAQQAVAPVAGSAPQATASFDWFDYQGKDPIFSTPLPAGTFQNPVLAGFYPDPSITRRGDDYYMVASSFTYAPGLPILHSRDLVNWTLLSYALTRPTQMDFAGLQVSRGIFAPTIRYHQGTFYLITTVVDRGGNFILTASDPAGPWSDPIWLPEIEGIDPDIFFDDDGKVYIAHNGDVPGEPLYEGHKAIWLWEYDPVAKKVLPDSKKLLVNGGVDLSTKPIWIEAPHLYKVDGWYYLLCAEGGTADQHSAVIFRSKSLNEPFVPHTVNPILTQRDLAPERPDPITTAGHADFVQTPNGDWWAVFLAARTYDQIYFNSGRETFLLPVSWVDGWPLILKQGETIPYRPAAPNIAAAAHESAVPAIASATPGKLPAAPLTGNFTWRDDFKSKTLDIQWNLLREFDQSWLKLDGEQLHIQAKPAGLETLLQPAFVSRRQQHMHYESSSQLQVPASGISAGMVAFQNEQYHYYLGVRQQAEHTEVFLEQAAGAAPKQLLSQNLPKATTIKLKISGQAGQISFYYAADQGEWQSLGPVQDGKLLSTQVATGFVGTMLGLYSRQENQQSPTGTGQ